MHNNMFMLSDKYKNDLSRKYAEKYGLALEYVDFEGTLKGAESSLSLRNSTRFALARHEGMQEGIRWGEASVFFLAPGIMSWVLPLLEGGELVGGLLGGEIIPEGVEFDRAAAEYHLIQSGCPISEIRSYIDSLKKFPQEKIREACESLREMVRSGDPESMGSLDRNRDEALQQREIANIIHERKGARSSSYSMDQERILLSLIRIGDKNAARGVLNDMLASSFLYSPKLSIIKARMIETMGYLVRSAIEGSTVLESLLEQQQRWINAIIEVDDFGGLCKVIRGALDHFIEQVFIQGFNRTNAHVSKALEYIAQNFTDKVTLDGVGEHVGLSKFRIAHLVKEVTGQSIMQHVKRMRVERAQELLAGGGASYSDITYQLGFTDQSAFIKQFRELTGTTPARYRKQCR